MKNMLGDISKRHAVVIGDVILDVYFMGEAKRLSPEAPVPIVKIKKKSTTVGGAGNVALNLAGLGCRTTLFGIRGADAAGDQMSVILAENGIHDAVLVESSQLTTSKTRIIGQGQQLLRLDEEQIWYGSPECRHRLLKDIEDRIDTADVVILSDYDKGVLHGDLPRQVIHRCHERKIPIFVDPKRRSWERYHGATCITPNTPEIEEVAGTMIDDDEEKLVAVAEPLRRRFNVDWLLVTRGAEGMCLIGSEAPPLFITAAAREVYDVSGAGDTVIAVLAAGVASGLHFSKAAQLSNLAAGIVVGKLGAQPISLGELEAASQLREAGINGLDRTKIAGVHTARLQVRAWQAAGERVSFAHGFFGFLYPSHIAMFNQAKELGDRLVVAMYTDDDGLNTPAGEVDRRLIPSKDRAMVLAAVSAVDLIILCNEDNPWNLIRALEPDVVIEEPNCSLHAVDGRRLVESYGGKVHVVGSVQV